MICDPLINSFDELKEFGDNFVRFKYEGGTNTFGHQTEDCGQWQRITVIWS